MLVLKTQPVLWWVDVRPAGGNALLLGKRDLSAFTWAQMVHRSHRDERRGRQTKGYFFVLVIHRLWGRPGRVKNRSFMACLTESWLHPSPERVALWPPLIAGIYDGGCPWPCGRGGLRGGLRWERRGKRGLLLPFSFPPQSGLLESPEERHRLLDQGMTSHKMVLYVFKKDELLFLTYPKKSILPLLNISRSFVPCQVTRQPAVVSARHWLFTTFWRHWEENFGVCLDWVGDLNSLVGLVQNLSEPRPGFTYEMLDVLP